MPAAALPLADGDTEVGYQFKTGYGIAYIRRMNLELQKMATRGLTVLAGAGDAGWTNVGERGNDLSGVDPTCGIMRAFYPSESPFVTSMSASFVTASGEATISVRGRPLSCNVVRARWPESVYSLPLCRRPVLDHRRRLLQPDRTPAVAGAYFVGLRACHETSRSVVVPHHFMHRIIKSPPTCRTTATSFH